MSPKQIYLILSILAGSSIVEAADEIPAKPTRSLFSRLCCCFCSAPPEEPVKLGTLRRVASYSPAAAGRTPLRVLVPQDEDSEEEEHSTKSPSAHPLDLHSALG